MAFNIRVYGILINQNNEVLLSDERRFGQRFTKFPGGGLEEGEGIKDCLVREFQEEIQIEIKVEKLFYLTDFYQKSAFNPEDQIISIYYVVSTNEFSQINASILPFDFKTENETEALRWRNISVLTEEDVTFPIDKIAVGMIRAKEDIF